MSSWQGRAKRLRGTALRFTAAMHHHVKTATWAGHGASFLHVDSYRYMYPTQQHHPSPTPVYQPAAGAFKPLALTQAHAQAGSACHMHTHISSPTIISTRPHPHSLQVQDATSQPTTTHPRPNPHTPRNTLCITGTNPRPRPSPHAPTLTFCSCRMHKLRCRSPNPIPHARPHPPAAPPAAGSGSSSCAARRS